MPNNTDALVVVKKGIQEMRTLIDTVAAIANGHIGSGGDAHPTCTDSTTGFMSADDYKRVLALQGKIDVLRNIVRDNSVPIGAVIWFSRNTDIPKDYVLCDGKNGTHNFKDRIVIGAANDAEVGQKGTLLFKNSDTDNGIVGKGLYAIQKVSDSTYYGDDWSGVW